MDNQDAGCSQPSVGDVSYDNSTEPPGTCPHAAAVRIPASKRHPIWKDVPTEQWDDWQWQMRNAIRTTRQMTELLPLNPAEVPALEQLESQYKLAIPPYYFSLIDTTDPADPIRLQSVPSVAEMTPSGGQELEDPLEEDQDSPVPGLTHRYPDRVLMVTTHVCSMYCRFCTRKRVTMDRSGWDAPSRNDQRMVEYVRQHPEVHDVIVSGGDPLSLPMGKLSWLVNELAAIDHVGVVRIGTRVPVTLPQRIFDTELVELLHNAGKIWIQTHFNHPHEITPESTKAIRLLVNAGMPVNNHAVLLKGVNDSVPTMRALMRGLLRIKVRPYYLFHCDPVVGAGHFRTSVWKGLEIMEGLRGHISGLGVPTYVVDGLHGAGKIPVMPNYLISASQDAVVLRNYEGLIFRYAPEHNEGPQHETYDSLGVSSLLGGQAQPLIPEGNRRLARRAKRAKTDLAATSDTPVNGDATPPVLVSIDVLAASGAATNGGPDAAAIYAVNGDGHANGNGHSPANGHSAVSSLVAANGVKPPRTNGRHAANGASGPKRVPRVKRVDAADGVHAGPPAGRRNRIATVVAVNGARPKVARSKATPLRKSAAPAKSRRSPPVS